MVTSVRTEDVLTNGATSTVKGKSQANGKENEQRLGEEQSHKQAPAFAAENSSKGPQYRAAGPGASLKSGPGAASGEISRGSRGQSQAMKATSSGNQKSVQQVYLDADYWYHKGVVLNQKGQNEYALNCYKQALELNSDHRASIFNLACAYERLNRFEKSLEGFQHAISVDEKWPDAHYGLALCCLQLKRYEDAVKHITNAMRWSIDDYNRKVRLRKEREDQRRQELDEALATGNATP